MLNGYSDKTLLDYLQQITDEKKYTGKVVLRDSTTGRGWRLHETSFLFDGVKDVRQAIINYIEERKRNYQPTEPSGKEVR